MWNKLRHFFMPSIVCPKERMIAPVKVLQLVWNTKRTHRERTFRLKLRYRDWS